MLAAGAILGMFLLSRRKRVAAHNVTDPDDPLGTPAKREEGEAPVIDWGALALVAAVALGSAALVVTLFATGLRLLAVESDSLMRTRRVAAVVCFAVCGLAVLTGVVLLLPLPL